MRQAGQGLSFPLTGENPKLSVGTCPALQRVICQEAGLVAGPLPLVQMLPGFYPHGDQPVSKGQNLLMRSSPNMASI